MWDMDKGIAYNDESKVLLLDQKVAQVQQQPTRPVPSSPVAAVHPMSGVVV